MITWQRKYFNGGMRNFICMCLVTFSTEFTAIDRGLVTAEIMQFFMRGHSPNAVSMLSQRRRRCTNIETALGECPVLAGLLSQHVSRP